MTITDFSLLSLTDQMTLLQEEGVYLGKRMDGRTPVILFQYDRWYVEIFYRKYRLEVEKIVYCDDTDILEPYLDSIPIDLYLIDNLNK